MSTIKGVLIDPISKTVSDIEIENNLTGMQHAIGDRHIELVRISNREDLYVDEEGLFVEDQEFFVITGDTGNQVPLAGKGLVIGSTPAGNNKSTKLTAIEVRNMVEFHSREQMFAMFG